MGTAYLRIAFSLCIVLLSAPMVSSAAASTQQPDWASVDAYVEAQRSASRIPGLALGVVQGSRVVHLQGFGLTGPGGAAVTPQTPFLIGSLSKPFTALAVMQLVEAGQVELDAPVQRYLPWFRVADAAASAQITVRHLLNHVSGIPNGAGLLPLLAGEEATLEEQVRALSEVQLNRPVGVSFEYSNANYLVLGMAVQVVSGQAYGDYIQEHVFLPLEMHHSYTSPSQAREHGIATGHRWWFGFAIAADMPYLTSAMPAGYLISSAEDMAHFLAANLSGGRYGSSAVLSPAGVAQMQEATVPSGKGSAYGLGWGISTLAGVKAISHEGATPDFYSAAIMAPAQGWGVIVLTNCTNMLAGQAARIARGVMALLLGQPLPEEGPSFGALYTVVDIVVVVLTGLLVLSIVLLPRWRRRLIARRPRFWGLLGRVLLPISADIAWPLVLLLLLPMGAGFPLWRVMALFQPDLTYWGLAMALAALAKGIVRIGLAATALRKAG